MDITGFINLISTATYFGGLAISIFTLRILIVTLRESVDLNRKQYKLISIEANRAAREIRPQFKFEYEVWESEQRMALVVNLEQHIARNITFTIDTLGPTPEH